MGKGNDGHPLLLLGSEQMLLADEHLVIGPLGKVGVVKRSWRRRSWLLADWRLSEEGRVERWIERLRCW